MMFGSTGWCELAGSEVTWSSLARARRGQRAISYEAHQLLSSELRLTSESLDSTNLRDTDTPQIDRRHLALGLGSGPQASIVTLLLRTASSGLAPQLHWPSNLP
eukprot:CAMPEP_0184296364 /NCGR_PEP_ID=MMETSP1049-20130417/7353_1 /TAXON_ID=77928 /ORGANISM="Proteomonas sulcata, Strain CCMP704" /LENGTH=103 /DNA_ID=CAMNT_0026605567 /DNA_START=52 /DNA_END=364 /DNA_ORIENTATION=-